MALTHYLHKTNCCIYYNLIMISVEKLLMVLRILLWK